MKKTITILGLLLCMQCSFASDLVSKTIFSEKDKEEYCKGVAVAHFMAFSLIRDSEPGKMTIEELRTLSTFGATSIIEQKKGSNTAKYAVLKYMNDFTSAHIQEMEAAIKAMPMNRKEIAKTFRNKDVVQAFMHEKFLLCMKEMKKL